MVSKLIATAGLLLALSATRASAAPAGWYSPARTPATVQTAPFAGTPNYAQATHTFRYGWFGAERNCPQTGWHKDYHADVIYWAKGPRW